MAKIFFLNFILQYARVGEKGGGGGDDIKSSPRRSLSYVLHFLRINGRSGINKAEEKMTDVSCLIIKLLVTKAAFLFSMGMKRDPSLFNHLL